MKDKMKTEIRSPKPENAGGWPLGIQISDFGLRVF
jgi:hypothetical protein